MGDRCSMEIISNEAASLAALWKLHKLTLIHDDNHNTIDSSTDLALSEDISAQFEAPGETGKPTFVWVKRTLGKLSRKEGTSKAHHGTFDDNDVTQMKQKIKWDDIEPFHVIPMVYREMQAHADLGGRLEQEWHSKLYYYLNKFPEKAAEFKLLLADGILPGWECSLPVNYASICF
ncbi:hypothetical protein FXO38_02908 [Capsicum annuum]|uniref:Transketolase N-terminal domain-containing protein n=1 Tax=Capsicum annuum TaxID=4072 RepID=A0A2G2Z1Y2_CAPAN|nr:hypothetical protein FXO37_31377 [Capsicum annuum]KAF3679118.1 hypothetical protein FXO38_02908 [Capsicum annuum]PHT76032.1 hypothetical protein T459_19554 [Capsicum annuum]